MGGCVAGFKLLAVDLDETLWDHRDISSLAPPFKRVGEDLIADSSGATVRLRSGARKALKELKARGVALAVVSWNIRGKAVEALAAFGLLELFDILVIEPHPRKDLMFGALLEWALKRGIGAEEVVFIDDNPLMVEMVKAAWPGVTALRFGRDVESFEDLLALFA